MSSRDFNKYTNSSDFKELLEHYEKVEKSGELVYFDCDDLIDIAEYYHEKDEPYKAEKAAQYCSKLYPEESAPKLFCARMALIDFADVEKAKRIMADLHEEKESIEGIYVRAEIMLCEGEVEEAEKYLQEKYARFVSHMNSSKQNEEEDEDEDDIPDFALDVALMYSDHDCFDLAEQWISKVPKLEDDVLVPFYDTWTRIYMSKGMYEEAEKTINKLIDTDSFNVNAWILLCDIQQHQARYNDALQSIEYAIAISPNEPNAYLSRGNCLYALNRLEEAEQDFKRYAQLTDGDALSDLILATTKFCRQDNDGAYEYAKKVYDNVEMLPPFQQLEALRTCATIAAKVADIGFAEQCCDRMRQMGVPDEEIDIIKGGICMETMELERAVAYFNKAVTKSEYDIKVIARIGIICYEAGAMPYAYRLLKEAVSVTKKNEYLNAPPRSLAFLAGACRFLGKRDEYLHYLEYAAKLMPLDTSSVLGDYFPLGTEPSQYLEIEKKNNRMGGSIN